MSVVKTITSKHTTVNLPDGVKQSGQFEFRVIRIASDEDAEELLEVYAHGVEIISQMLAGGVTYVYVRAFLPSKIALK